jgi:hypothetical protein
MYNYIKKELDNFEKKYVFNFYKKNSYSLGYFYIFFCSIVGFFYRIYMDGFNYTILFPIFIFDSNISFNKLLLFLFIHFLLNLPICIYLFYHLPNKIFEYENELEIRSFSYNVNEFYKKSKKKIKSIYYDKLISLKKIFYNK